MAFSARTNQSWVTDLRGGGESQASALADLRANVLKGLPYALQGYLPPDHPELDALSDEIAQETLLRVLDRLDTFEGRSQFTTWVHKIAIRLAFSELRRRRWKDISLDAALDNEAAPAMPEPLDPGVNPETQVERKDLMAKINQALREELTEKQRLALHAVAMQGIPMEEVARKMGMQRNALYKLLHDARKRLKQRMERMGLTPDAMLATFEKDSR